MEQKFRSQVSSALDRAKLVLAKEKRPRSAAEVDHVYDDKYLLAEFLTNTAAAASLNILESFGLSQKDAEKVAEWASARNVSLRFSAEERCVADGTQTREVESSSYVTEKSGGFFGSSTTTDKVITKVTDYFWKFDFEYELYAFEGNDPKSKVVLSERKGTTRVKTSSEDKPRKDVVVRPHIDANVTWLFERVNKGKMNFQIDRDDPNCHTPSNNPQVAKALAFFAQFRAFFQAVDSYFLNTLFPILALNDSHTLNSLKKTLNSAHVFVPVAPLFDASKTEGSALEVGGDDKGKGDEKEVSIVSGSGVVPLSYINPFLGEQLRSLKEQHGRVRSILPESEKVISAAEGCILITAKHGSEVCTSYTQGIDFIENLIRTQLIAAIGKSVGVQDISDYMRFHNRRLYKEEHAPRLFSYAIRRPDHYPEGVLAIEQRGSEDLPQPIQTLSVSETAKQPMYFPISQSTKVAFYGERRVHSWMSHSFSGSTESLTLTTRARQFSCFILLVGRIAGANLFDPKHALIIQNKDDLKLPLLLETIPTAKEFKDAIESLSPEQQRFAKAFRSMQLESTLFGVCIVQIKPQLERLLRLPNDSLTKEIKLTQDLLSLFIEYHIPSDQLSFDGPENASLQEKIRRVRFLADEMLDLIKGLRQDEENEARKKREMERAELEIRRREQEEKLMYIEEETVKRKKGGRAPMPRKKMAKAAAPQMMMAAPCAPPMDRMSSCVPCPPPASAPTPSPAPSPAPSAPPPPSPSPAPAQPTSSEPAPADSPPEEKTPGIEESDSEEASGGIFADLTKVPALLDSRSEKLDLDSALRPTIINMGKVWSFESQKNILSALTTTRLEGDAQKTQKEKAFDLLDALSRSGSLPIMDATLHVVIAATHCFDQSVMDTLVKDSVNPIEKLERSSLIIATTLHQCKPEELVKENELERVQTYSRNVFEDEDFS
mmetsp:Transcript_7931/g.11977  ORF Transcript_7931/g.11977 Transcript_7931/m.11977 type:complete len:945 (-) Transcript_7931:62-2896(-)|eukprot:CAMPEP_0201522004 /NCGR_PEP_ID=MMETSP0161_2-20130828/16396_1 /ASSEMBLY_ACC=CAM_ASM_000251 /TAXON_ID=180227 /ORGANISM="Neoparamoeba aestuarina, Strain SoJaBio B1-5/56/2" /LENGTH=944 /DNA_ID=CAMNT_0047920753 /DNA_START=62 /DNA_END=2896 /DNA_ORIENTATION=+